jgi:O-antigen/teichoic acid export membrane protein
MSSGVPTSQDHEKASATTPVTRTLRSQLLSGSLILISGSGLVGAANFVYNVTTARMLGPTDFGHATTLYTLLMLMSAVTLSFQIVCTKLVANHHDPAEKAAVYIGLHHRAWRIGILIGLTLVLARNLISNYLNLPEPVLIVFLAVGTAFYIPLGARRGCMQGMYSFGRLAVNLILEGMVRLIGAFTLIKLGLGVDGAVLASVAAIIVAYLFATPAPGLKLVPGSRIRASFYEGLQAIVFFIGQVIINNFDIVLVKHFFPSEEAGLYAAVALVGRFVNMCAWSVVNSMFPVSAGKSREEREGKHVLLTSLGLVLLILSLVILGLWLVPSFLWRMVFGAQFDLAGYGAISSLLILYALTTGVYSLSAVIMAYEMSRKIANTSWIQLVFSGAFVTGIYLFHSDLTHVILVQLVLMLALFVVVLFPVLRSSLRGRTPGEILGTHAAIRKIAPLSEAEVIAEFLRNEFHHPELSEYREKLGHLVDRPDFSSPQQNALRRALLFIRRGAMWRELPEDTQWFEVSLTARDLARIRVFPRAQWRRVAQDSFYLTDIVERIRTESRKRSDDEFFEKLRRLSPLIKEQEVNESVLLIGVDERGPLTILDGNHRMTAATLVARAAAVKQFRFICGFSPRMTECCWYQTNVVTLWRYAKNLVRYMPYDPESDVGRFLQTRS